MNEKQMLTTADEQREIDEAKEVIGTHFRASALISAIINDVSPIVEARDNLLKRDPQAAAFALHHGILPPDFRAITATNHCADCRQIISRKRLRCLAHFQKFTEAYQAKMAADKAAQAGVVVAA